MSPLRVDNIPFWLKPFFLIYGYGIGYFTVLWFRFVKATCSVTYHVHPEWKEDQAYVYAFWHTFLPMYFCTHTKYKRPFVWMNHPIWFMKPIHVLLNATGTEELMLGSSGNSGRQALERVIEALKNGRSTAINPDGPAGPEKKLKKGVLDMSERAGVPVIPVFFKSKRKIQLNFTRDKKQGPQPFTKVDVYYGKPIRVTVKNRERAAVEISDQMSGFLMGMGSYKVIKK